MEVDVVEEEEEQMGFPQLHQAVHLSHLQAVAVDQLGLQYQQWW